MRYLSAFYIFIFIVLSGISAYSSEEDMANWDSVTVIAQAGSFKDVKVTAEIEWKGSEEKFKLLKVFSGLTELVIPAEATKDILNPALSTLMVSSEAGYGEFPLLYVSFLLSNAGAQEAVGPTRIYFAFQENKFIKRFATRLKKDGSRDFIEDWKLFWDKKGQE